MKKLLIPLLLIALHSGFCSQIQIHAIFDKNKVLSSYEVWTWDGKDQDLIRTSYTIADAQTKFGTLLSSGSVGTSKTPDVVYLNFDGSGTLVKAEAQVSSASSDKFESKAVDVTAQISTDAAATKADVVSKESKNVSVDAQIDEVVK
jgi:hypothetical protein